MLLVVVMILLMQRLVMRLIPDELRRVILTQMQLLVDDVRSIVDKVLLRVRSLNMPLVQDV